MAEVSMSVKAFVKPMLHAAKYPHCAVNGLLLAESQKGKDGKMVKLVDAVPLFHSSLTLAPMMEIALTQIDAFCRSHGYIIAGYYQANENFDNSNPAGVAFRLADKLKENFSDACLLMVDNTKALTECEQAYILYTSSDSKWKKSDKRILTDDDVGAIGLSLIKSRAYRGLVDFDNHLDDISMDWQNQDINEQIGQSPSCLS